MSTKTELVNIRDIDLDDQTYRFREEVKENEFSALAENISNYGLQNPVKLRILANGVYQVLAGWRRILAVKKLLWAQIPAIIYKDITDETALEINILDNAHRRNLNLVEQARQVKLLKEQDHDINDIADLLGLGTQRVYDLLVLARTEQPIKQLVIDNKLTLAHVVELHKLPREIRLEYANRVVEEKWGVRKLKEERVNLTSTIIGEPTKRVYDAVRVLRTPEVLNHFKLRMLLVKGVSAPFKCEYPASIPAMEEHSSQICDNDIAWAVLAPPNYYYRQEEYRGREVPLERRDAWFFGCQEHCVKLFGRVRFHFYEDYFSHCELFGPEPEEASANVATDFLNV